MMIDTDGLVGGQPRRAARPGPARALRLRLTRPGTLRAALTYGSMPALSAVNAVVGLLLPKLLGPVEFGHYALVVTMFQYGLILDLGLSQLIDRRVPVLVACGDEPGLRRFANEVLWVRLYVAVLALAVGAAVMLTLDRGGRLPFPLLPGMLSLMAGLGFMLALGPMSVWRAMADRIAFARWTIATAMVLAVARPVGMLAGGLAGCFALLALGYAGVAAVLQAGMPLRRTGRPGPWRAVALLARGAPLFATSFVWAFYMTANRWILSMLTSGAELGQFAFGANAVYLIVGSVAALAQLHYPALVSRAASSGPFGVSRAVGRDLSLLALAVSMPTAAGILAGPYLIDLVYPSFSGAHGPLSGLMVAVPNLVVASWLMPLSLSTAQRPWIEGIVIYPTALAVLAVATWTGFRLHGIGGAGWGLAVSSLPLVLMQLIDLRLVRLLRLPDAARILAATLACTAALAMLARLG